MKAALSLSECYFLAVLSLPEVPVFLLLSVYTGLLFS